MRYTIFRRCNAVKAATLLAGLLIWPAIGAADVSGQARAVQATVLGVSTVLADTGTLGGADDAREASSLTGAIPMLGVAEVLHATTISSTDGGGSVASEASAANVGLSVPGNTIAADFVMARVLAPASGASTAVSGIDGLAINGVPVSVTGAPNQTIGLIGGRVVINEQLASATGTVVNALHIIVDGVADVVIASAAAGITSSSASQDTAPTLLDTTTSTVQSLPSLF